MKSLPLISAGILSCALLFLTSLNQAKAKSTSAHALNYEKDETTWYADSDHDGYGNPAVFVIATVAPPDFVSDNTDCDDNNAAIHPGATELCNGLDDDCNGIKDDNVAASQVTVLWEKDFGGSKDDIAQAMDITSDGGYIIAGSTASSDGNVTLNNGKTDMWLVRLNAYGTLLWQKSFGGSNDENAQAVKQTKDGGYIFCGPSYSINGDIVGNHGSSDFAVIKLDSNGNVSWQKCFGGSSSDNAASVDQTFDGGYVIAGTTSSDNGNVTGSHPGGDYWIIKLDKNGNLNWQKAYGGSAPDFSRTVIQSRDSGYLVSGFSRSNDGNVLLNHGQEDMWILKLDKNGNIVWQKSYGGTGGDGANSAQQTADGGYILAGTTHSFNLDVDGNHGQHDYWVVKIDSSGNSQWKECLGGSDSEDGNWVRLTSDGGYIVTGSSSSTDGDVTGHHAGLDFWAVKLSATGSIEWQKSLGGSLNEESFSIFPTADGNYVVSGYSKSTDGDINDNHGGSDFCIMKITPPSMNKFYADADGDGYGNPLQSIEACSAPPGYVSDFSDCNDANALVHPGVEDFCNGIDDNCNGLIDENSVVATISPLTTATICTSSTLTLQSTIDPAYTYQWKRNGTVLSGATQSSYTVNGPGTYSVVVTKGPCSANSPSTIIKMTPPMAMVQPPGIVKSCPGVPVTLSVMGMPGITYQWNNSNGPIAGATEKKYAAIAVGNYFVTESDIAGCSFNSNTSMVKNYAAVSTSITASGDLNICVTGSVTLNAQVISGYTFQWFRNGSAISGATGTSYVAVQSGNYKYFATTTNGCTAFSAITIVAGCKSEGLASNSDDDHSLEIYPNPTSRNFNISMKSENGYSGESMIEVYNSLGQLVISQTAIVTDGKLISGISLPSDISDGFYFVKLLEEQNEYRAKLVVVK